MAQRDIIVVGASAGGVEALKDLVAGLPANLPASLFVVMHLAPRQTSLLPKILSHSGPLPAIHAEDGGRVEKGRIYIAPPDHHLILQPDHMHLGSGPKEQNHRPCINVTFRSAAAAYGPRVTGVILTGHMDDGVAGLWEIQRRGGLVIVQNPEEAPFPSMPLNALRELKADMTLRVAEIGPALNRLAQEEITAEGDRAERETPSAMTAYACPECRGSIWRIAHGYGSEYRCRVGHTYSSRTMLVEHYATQEKMMWATVVVLEEGAALAIEVARSLEEAERDRLETEAKQVLEQANEIHQMIQQRRPFTIG